MSFTNSCHNSCQNERGAVLVIALMFMAILAMLGTTAVVMTTTDMQIGANYKASAQAFYDADAGVNYAIAKIEAGLEDGSFPLPSTIGNSTSLAAFTAPTGFGFSYQSPGLTMVAQNRFSFTTMGAGPNSSSTTIVTTCKRQPAIEFGAFGDKKLDLGNMAAVYSYSHSTTPSPPPVDSPGKGDVGSNESVILRNNSIVDGDVALGEDAGGTDGTLTDQGGIVSGTNGEDVDRVDPDPLGVVGGEYAAKFTTYSATNDNAAFAVGSITTTGASLTIGPNETLTLKGQTGGSNFYWHDVTVKSDFLYIDTTDGPVNIYVTGTFDAQTGSQVINTTDASCTDPDDPAGTAPSCGCCDTATPNPNNTCTRGVPSDFAIFANSQSSTDKILIHNSVEFSGLIYAPYLLVRLNNSADIYGAIVGREVEIANRVEIFYDTDLAEDYLSSDLSLATWRDVRN